MSSKSRGRPALRARQRAQAVPRVRIRFPCGCALITDPDPRTHVYRVHAVGCDDPDCSHWPLLERFLHQEARTQGGDLTYSHSPQPAPEPHG